MFNGLTYSSNVGETCLRKNLASAGRCWSGCARATPFDLGGGRRGRDGGRGQGRGHRLRDRAAPLAGQRGDHRDQQLGMAAPQHAIVAADHEIFGFPVQAVHRQKRIEENELGERYFDGQDDIAEAAGDLAVARKRREIVETHHDAILVGLLLDDARIERLELEPAREWVADNFIGLRGGLRRDLFQALARLQSRFRQQLHLA